MTEERRHGPIERRMHPWYRDRVMLGLLASIVCSIILFFLYESQSGTLDGQAKKLNRQAHQLGRVAAELVTAQELIGSEYTAQVESCRRLNILRVEDNVSHGADYDVDRFVLVAQQAALRAGIPNATPQQIEFERHFTAPLTHAVKSKTWTPRTECAKAVNRHGSRFRAPRPVPFSRRPPPYSAMHLLPVDFQ